MAGVYEVCVRGTDALDNVGAPECAFLVAYDPSGGFVTGELDLALGGASILQDGPGQLHDFGWDY